NWSNNAVPGSADDVSINAPGVTISHSSSSTVNSLTLVNGAIAGGDLAINDLFSWSGGSLRNGSLTAAGGMALSGSLTLDGFTLVNPAGQTAAWWANLTAVHGAQLNNYGTLDNQADVTLSGDPTATFNNYGAFIKSAGDPTFYYDDHYNPPSPSSTTAHWSPFPSSVPALGPASGPSRWKSGRAS